MAESSAPRRAWVGLGSNLNDPPAQLGAALSGLASFPDSRVVRCSHLYQTPPWGELEQPVFLNAVVELETTLSATHLLRGLLALECAAGRVRGGSRWGPRRIDLDLLFVEGEQRDQDPVLPHPRMHQRAFVLVPLAELEPGLCLGEHGRVEDLLGGLDHGEILDLGPLSAQD